jgi:Mn2+/Fe2+ NRAMP family transporter
MPQRRDHGNEQVCSNSIGLCMVLGISFNMSTTPKFLFDLTQIWLPLVGLPTIYFTSKKSKLAPVFGLLGQPAWFYSSAYTHQWGVFALNVAYAAMWCLTAYRWWWPKPESPLKGQSCNR